MKCGEKKGEPSSLLILNCIAVLGAAAEKKVIVNQRRSSPSDGYM
jgi:hypothetical protein